MAKRTSTVPILWFALRRGPKMGVPEGIVYGFMHTLRPAIAGRFVCHFLSGVIFFWMYAPPEMNPAVYSAIYNGSYLAVELVFSTMVMYVLSRRGVIDMYL